jgi:hypothetical protein
MRSSDTRYAVGWNSILIAKSITRHTTPHHTHRRHHYIHIELTV